MCTEGKEDTPGIQSTPDVQSTPDIRTMYIREGKKQKQKSHHQGIGGSTNTHSTPKMLKNEGLKAQTTSLDIQDVNTNVGPKMHSQNTEHNKVDNRVIYTTTKQAISAVSWVKQKHYFEYALPMDTTLSTLK